MENKDLTSYQMPVRTTGETGKQSGLFSYLPVIFRCLVAVVTTVILAFSPILLWLIPGFLEKFEAMNRHFSLPYFLIYFVLFLLFPALLSVLICAGYLKYWQKESFSQLGLAFNRRAILWFLVIFLETALIALMILLIGKFAGWEVKTLDPKGLPWGAVLAAAIIQGFFMQAIPEEMVWRGWLIVALKKYFPRTEIKCYLCSVIIFSSLHLFSNTGIDHLSWWQRLVYLSVPFSFACLASVARYYSGSIWPAIAAHGGLHFFNIVLIPQTTDYNGPLVWAITATLYLLATMATLLVLHALQKDH